MNKIQDDATSMNCIRIDGNKALPWESSLLIFTPDPLVLNHNIFINVFCP